MSRMRTTCLALLAAALVTACTGGAPGRPAAAATCTAGWSSGSPVIHLSLKDAGRSLTAPLCDSIAISLAGSPGVQWLSVETSDPTVLEIVPLPLPRPQDGGANAVYLARRTGSAVLSSSRPAMACPPEPGCPAPPPWTVRITVVAQPARLPG